MIQIDRDKQHVSVIGHVDPEASLTDMQRNCPSFFRYPCGSRECYNAYRGCLIVRSTVKFIGGAARRTIVYLYLPNGFAEGGPATADTFCVSAGCELKNVTQAKRLIDAILDGGIYYYGIQPATKAKV